MRDQLIAILDRDRKWPDAVETADAILAAMPAMIDAGIPDIVWEDFDGRGAKAKAWGKANYLITRWSDGRFELVESYPGYQGDNLAGGFCESLEAAKAAANAHNRATLMSAIGMGVE